MLLSEAQYYQDEITSHDYVYVQPKLDGWRAIINTVTGVIYSRYGNIISLPHISRDVIGKGLSEWIDGELYCHGCTLGQIQSMIKKQDDQISFFCFDTIRPGKFSSRYTTEYNPVSTYKIKPHEINQYYQDFLNRGYEGIVIRFDAEYQQGRSKKIFKLKPSCSS